MFSSHIHGFKVFLVSLILCVPSSAVSNLLVFWLSSRYFPLRSEIPQLRDALAVLAMGAFIGIFKFLLVSPIAFQVEPFLRWRVIVVSTIVLTLFEGWFYYELWTWTFPISV